MQKKGCYVASKFEDAALTRVVQDYLIEHSFSITHDWTKEFYKEDDRENVCDRDTYERRCASADIRGVRAARVLVVIPHPFMKGGYIEVGAALALDIPVVAFFLNTPEMSMEERRASWNKQVFSRLCEYAYTLDDVVTAVRVAHELPPIGLSYAVCNVRP